MEAKHLLWTGGKWNPRGWFAPSRHHRQRPFRGENTLNEQTIQDVTHVYVYVCIARYMIIWLYVCIYRYTCFLMCIYFCCLTWRVCFWWMELWEELPLPTPSTLHDFWRAWGRPYPRRTMEQWKLSALLMGLFFGGLYSYKLYYCCLCSVCFLLLFVFFNVE